MKKILFILIIFCVTLAAQQEYTISVDYNVKNLPYGLTKKIPKAKPIVALALSGGGARGISQIGVIRALEEAHIPIDLIVGTSMGSIIGGLYSAGYSTDQLDSITESTDWNSLLSLDKQTSRTDLFIDQKVTEDKAVFSLRLKGLTPVIPTSFNNGQKLSNFLNLLTLQAPIHAKASFDELKPGFRAVCTDLTTGNPVIISSGSLSQAMRASSSVSFFLSPVQMDSLVLVDGGLVANIPVEIARKVGGNYVIAVNTTSSLHKLDELNLPWTVADQVVSIPLQILNQEQLNEANIVINPDLKTKTATDFTNLDSLVEVGYLSTLPHTDKIRHDLDSMLEANLKEKNFYIHNIRLNSTAEGIEKELEKKYSMMDSVSSYEILTDLYRLFDTGDYENLKVILSPDKNFTSFRVVYTETPIINSVNVTGIKFLNIDTVLSPLKKLEGTRYNGERVLKSITDVINLYRSGGLSMAQVNNLSFDPASGALSIDIDEGIISQVVIEGNVYTNPTIITREFPLGPGDYFEASKALQGLKNLRSTNLFDDLVLSVKRINNQNIIVLTVIERISNLVRFGFRADDEYKLQVSVDVRDENVLGTGTELGFIFTGGARNRKYLLEHRSNRLLNTYFTYNLNGFYGFRDVSAYRDVENVSANRFSLINIGEYREIAYGGSISLGTQVERFGNLIFKGIYQVNQTKNLQFNPVSPEKLNIVSLRISSTVDTQDDYPYARSGIYFNGFYETAQKKLGGDVGFTNIGFDYKVNFTFHDVHTLIPRISMGFGDKTLPLTQQYSLGGINSFFGMRQDESRGRQLFLSSLEYRYMLPVAIFFDTYFKLRYDLGSMWVYQEQIKFKDLRHGLGATLSFDTPVGPADFAVGKSFFFRNPGNIVVWGDTQFYFSIGYFF